MRRSIVIAAATLCFAFGGAQEVQAQDYAQQVWSQLQKMREVYSEATLQNYIIGHLADDRSDSWTLGFAAGATFVLGGACDTDCSDLDIIVKDEAGNIIAKDDTDDDVPIVRFTTKAAARYTIELKMYECSTSTCYFGFGVFRQ
jgi:hypothetical protein